MPIFKETWNFSSPNGGFWSEVYYANAVGLDEVADYPEAFLAKRLALLHPVNKLDSIRVSDVEVPRVALPIPFNRQGTASTFTQFEGPGNLSEAAVITLVSTVRPASRKLWMRGMPEGYVSRTQTGQDYQHPTFKEALKNWLNALAGATPPYIILKKVPSDPDLAEKVRVVRVDGTAANGTAIITTAVGHNLQLIDPALIQGTDPKLVPGLRGKFAVISIPTNLTAVIPYRTPQDAAIDLAKGTVERLRYYVDAVIAKPPKSGFAFLGVRRSKNAATGSRGARHAASLRLS